MITPLVVLAVQARLARMFAQDSHLDICDLKRMWKLAEVEPSQDLMDTLGLHHCVKWEKLPPELRVYSAIAVAESFGWSPDEGRMLASGK